MQDPLSLEFMGGQLRTMHADQRTLRSDFNVFRREVKAGLDALDARAEALGDLRCRHRGAHRHAV